MVHDNEHLPQKSSKLWAVKLLLSTLYLQYPNYCRSVILTHTLLINDVKWWVFGRLHLWDSFALAFLFHLFRLAVHQETDTGAMIKIFERHSKRPLDRLNRVRILHEKESNVGQCHSQRLPAAPCLAPDPARSSLALSLAGLINTENTTLTEMTAMGQMWGIV